MQVREMIAKAPCEPEEKILLSHVADVLERSRSRNIPTFTDFLSPREQALVRSVLNMYDCTFWGGREDAERTVCISLPDYLDKTWLYTSEAPLTALRAEFSDREKLTHRDFLGSLMGCGIQRSAVGDILVSEHSADFFVTRAMAPYIRQNLLSAGRVKLSVSEIDLSEVRIPEQKVTEQRDTVASLRLDAVCASAFRLSREKAAIAIQAGRVSLNNLPCEKPDKAVGEGDSISLRGAGKALLAEVSGKTKKGRIAIVLRRYV
ncbi:MAG: RNA-binding protein [Ruminococcaceae bacterium]|nr:RNA-binding protein [Oscillospiraceae bacterium]